jgi:hypothetical protein
VLTTRRVLSLASPVLLACLTLTGCGSSPSSQDTEAVRPPATADPTPVSASPTWPEDVDAPTQGGTYTAVVLATGSQAELDASLDSVAAYGYDAAVSDAGCLQGAAKTLDLPAGALVTSLLFADEATAARFADAYVAAEDGLMVGRAEVRTYCLD